MTSQQADLFSRIRAFQFQPNGSTFTFEDRLAKENGWPRSFTERAIEEYRRFLVLAATVGHPVSPPDAVDQVWHLHLLYTRSYWEELCASVLPRRLHHEPSTGGAGERATFDDWYARTVESYRRTFGTAPPSDIWPALDAPRRHEVYRRVDLARHWLLPRRGVAHALLGALLVIVLLALAGGCTSMRTAAAETTTLNPLDLRGPQFLGFYVAAFIVGMTAAMMVRAAVLGPGNATIPGDREDLDPYEVAYLRGGARPVVNVAVTQLVARGLLVVNPRDGTLRAASPVPAGLYPVEAAVHRAVSPTLGTRLSQVYSVARNEAEHVARRLRDRELLEDEFRAGSAAALGTIVALAVPAVGVVKIFVGLARGRPVGFLVVVCIVTTAMALLIFAGRSRLTRRGRAVLKRVMSDHRDLRRPRIETATAALPMAVALFGFEALAHTELAPLRRTASHAGGESGGFGSGCGAGGSGCGSSCGGGGCGGGGCGGCGGCGG